MYIHQNKKKHNVDGQVPTCDAKCRTEAISEAWGITLQDCNE